MLKMSLKELDLDGWLAKHKRFCIKMASPYIDCLVLPFLYFTLYILCCCYCSVKKRSMVHGL